MIYRRFGKTNLQMPVISCGGMRYQFKWQDVPLAEIPAENQENLDRTIRRALDLGSNHIETARGYGSSERQLGLILPKLPRDKMIVQTKISPREKPDDFLRDFEDSLARLQLGYVDLFALHGINNRQLLDWSLRPGGCLSVARKIQQRGLARHIGFSTHGPLPDILECLRHEADGGFDYVNLHWYYILQINWPAVEEAARRDVGVFIISPSDKGGMLYQPSQLLVELCQPLHPIIFNDLFCLSRPQVCTLSVGASRPADFDLHVQAVDLLNHAGELLPPILDRLDRTMAETVEPDLQRPFALNLPPWEQIPGQINVAMILWLRNLARAYGMTAYGQMRYNLLGNGGHWFPGNHAGKVEEVDLRPTAAACGLGDRLVPILREAHDSLYKAPVKRLSQGG